MRVVLRAILERARLAPVTSGGERVARRAITFTPGRGGRILVEAA
jgi:hypothetical protein